MTHCPSSEGTSTKRAWLEWASNAGGAAAGRTGDGGPAWRAIASRTSPRSSRSEIYIEFDLVNDADDGGVNGRRFSAERLTRRTSFEDDQHSFVHACANAVDG